MSARQWVFRAISSTSLRRFGMFDEKALHLGLFPIQFLATYSRIFASSTRGL